MKKLFIFIGLTGLVLVGCSDTKNEKIVVKEDSAMLEKENPGTIKLELLHKEDVDIFKNAVKNSKKEPGIVNMVSPEFHFSIDEESYFLWITKETGTIMNTKDTHTIYTLTKNSVKDVYEFVQSNQSN